MANKTTSRVLSTRVSPQQLDAIRRLARTRGLSMAALVHSATTILVSDDPNKLASLKAILELDPNCSAQDVLDAVSALVDALGDENSPGDEGTTEAPDPQPNAPGVTPPAPKTAKAATSALSAEAPSARELFDAKKAGLTVPEFRAAKLRMLRRVGALTSAGAAPSAREPFDAKKAGLTVSEFRAAKAALLRRTPSKKADHQ